MFDCERKIISDLLSKVFPMLSKDYQSEAIVPSESQTRIFAIFGVYTIWVLIFMKDKRF